MLFVYTLCLFITRRDEYNDIAEIQANIYFSNCDKRFFFLYVEALKQKWEKENDDNEKN